MKKRVKHFLTILIIAIIVVYTLGFIGSIFINEETGSDWYNEIKPSITPPNWVFPIVWNILFFLIAVSITFVIINSKKEQRKYIIIFYGINLFFNTLWSFLYFGMHNPFLAFLDLIIIWASILVLIIFNFGISKKAAILLIPYLLWVSFAGIINYLS